jgi:hypothetical protein
MQFGFKETKIGHPGAKIVSQQYYIGPFLQCQLLLFRNNEVNGNDCRYEKKDGVNTDAAFDIFQSDQD